MKIRSFLAFDISDEMRGELASIIALLSKKVSGVKWIEPKLMHCTVRFFGEVEEDVLMGKLSEVIERELRHQAPMSFLGKGIGVFPNWRYPRVLWAGLSGDTDSALSLHAKLEEAFEEFDFEKDERAFRLHLTLGRAKKEFKDVGGFAQLVEKLTEKEFGKTSVNSLSLYKSVLGSDGPVYTLLKRFPLGAAKKGKQVNNKVS